MNHSETNRDCAKAMMAPPSMHSRRKRILNLLSPFYGKRPFLQRRKKAAKTIEDKSILAGNETYPGNAGRQSFRRSESASSLGALSRASSGDPLKNEKGLHLSPRTAGSKRRLSVRLDGSSIHSLPSGVGQGSSSRLSLFGSMAWDMDCSDSGCESSCSSSSSGEDTSSIMSISQSRRTAQSNVEGFDYDSPSEASTIDCIGDTDEAPLKLDANALPFSIPFPFSPKKTFDCNLKIKEERSEASTPLDPVPPMSSTSQNQASSSSILTSSTFSSPRPSGFMRCSMTGEVTHIAPSFRLVSPPSLTPSEEDGWSTIAIAMTPNSKHSSATIRHENSSRRQAAAERASVSTHSVRTVDPGLQPPPTPSGGFVRRSWESSSTSIMSP